MQSEADKELRDRITALEAQLATARRDALEEAAKVAEGWQSSLRPGSIDRLHGHNEAARNIAQAIRTLMDKTDAE